MHSKQNNLSSDKNKSSLACVVACLLAAFSIILTPSISLAGANVNWAASLSAFGLTFTFGSMPGSGGIAGALCTIVGWFQGGGIGAAIASLAVIFMGIAAFFGKVTWGMAATTACGIFAIFGSGPIISSITNGMGTGCG